MQPNTKHRPNNRVQERPRRNNHYNSDLFDDMKAIKAVELIIKDSLVKSGTVQQSSDVRLIPAESNSLILFIDANNVAQNASALISMKLDFDLLKNPSNQRAICISIGDMRLSENDCIFNGTAHLVDENMHVDTDAYVFTDIIAQLIEKYEHRLYTYRIRMANSSLFLSGYNDYISDSLEKELFPMFSEKKFKLYSSMFSASKVAARIAEDHPALKVEVE